MKPTKDETKNHQSHNLVKKAIQKTNKNFAHAMAKSDAAGVANCYTIDAEFMAPGAPSVKGRKNIQAAIAGFIKEGFTEYKVLSTIVHGNIDVVGVQAAYTLSKKNGADKDVGKSIQLWKEEDGEWRIFRDCFNSDLSGS